MVSLGNRANNKFRSKKEDATKQSKNKEEIRDSSPGRSHSEGGQFTAKLNTQGGEVEVGKHAEERKESTPRKKTHWKSQSVSETTKDTTSNFTQNRELWQRRAASQGQIEPPVAQRQSQDLWELRQKQTPDLVMDLPVVGNQKEDLIHNRSSIAEEEMGSEASSPGPESPDMTAAERFAKQNQCTLKKNTKVNLPRSKGNGEIISEKTSTSQVENLSNFLNSDKIIQVKNELELVINPVAHQQRLTPKLPVKFASAANPPVSSVKPPFKPKPQILKKPILPLPVLPTQPPAEQKETPNLT
ncbi:hypothetical protein RUM43_004717 [Polyplax serrata]|uniref:Uncharacterized protein n=1 Tax=Polyplax serrata TaxID=468196 RepID=A0AAN8SB58_POLSC